jgi:GTP pyrophosphokinase
MAMLVARHIQGQEANPTDKNQPKKSDLKAENKIKPVVISGNEPSSSVHLAPCCLPIPGDALAGQLRRDQTLQVHVADCEVAKRQRAKEQGRWIDVHWAKDHARRFECRIRVLLQDEKGALARLAAEINESDSNIVHVGMDESKAGLMTELKFTIQVEDRIHLARLMRNVKRVKGVERILRERG